MIKLIVFKAETVVIGDDMEKITEVISKLSPNENWFLFQDGEFLLSKKDTKPEKI